MEGAENMSNEEGIVALSALLVEYGSKDGGQLTNTLNTIDDDSDNGNKNIIGGTDVSAYLNN